MLIILEINTNVFHAESDSRMYYIEYEDNNTYYSYIRNLSTGTYLFDDWVDANSISDAIISLLLH